MQRFFKIQTDVQKCNTVEPPVVDAYESLDHNV